MNRLAPVLSVVLVLSLATAGCLSGLLGGSPATVIYEVSTPADNDAPGVNGSDVGDFAKLVVRIGAIHSKPADNTEVRWATVERSVDLVEIAGTDGTSVARVKYNATKSYSRFGLTLSVDQAVLRNGTSVNISHIDSYQVKHDDPVKVERGSTIHYRFVVTPLYNDEDIPGPDGQYFLMVPQWQSGPVTS